LPGRQGITWGFNYRFNDDRTGAVPTTMFVPANRDFNLISAFVQDEIGLLPDTLRLTLGSKFEHNDFSGFEYQPSGRLLWTPLPWQTIWASISRAVRTPSRVEDGLLITAPPMSLGPLATCQLPAPLCFPRVIGDGNFGAEKILAYELGHRLQPFDPLFIDTAIFYNRYSDLLSLETGASFLEDLPPPPHQIVPLFIRNRLDGESYGFEIAADTVITDWWRLNATYSYLQVQLQRDATSNDVTQRGQARDSPHHSFFLRSITNLPGRWEIDGMLRYVEGLPHQRVEGYSTLDVRVAKHVTEQLELAAVGQNLLQEHHREFGGGTQMQRGAYGQVRWRW